MENYLGYIIMKEYVSGSKSDGFSANLYVSSKKVYKLYRADVLPAFDTFFNEFHLKYVQVNGVLNTQFNSISVESIEMAKDPFLSTDEEEVKNDEA
jgi:hypothetical protein